MKELEEIYQEMLDCFAQRTGLEAAESCDLAVRFYAVAAQVYALYAQADWVLPNKNKGSGYTHGYD